MRKIEMKLLLTRYNKLSEERADAAYMWTLTGESVRYESKWSMCVDEMSKMRDELRKCGYEFASIGSKVVGKVQHEEYKIVPVRS